MSASREIWQPIGRFIKEVVKRLGDNTSISIGGVNIEKGFIPTVANMAGVDTSKYKLVPYNHFACNLMHVGRDITIPIAYNNKTCDIAVSPAYYVFTIQKDALQGILPSYLEMLLTREEFGRLSWFHTDGSIRGNLPEQTFKEILVPVPDIDVQQELVDTYNGLKALAEQNEALIEPLSKACEAFIVDCKTKYPEVELGEYIEELSDKNKDGYFSKVLGLSTQKEFREPNSRVNKDDLFNYKIVPYNCFAYVPTTDTWKVFACAINKGEPIVVSPIYCVFKITSNQILPDFLPIIYKRAEFDRYARFNSWGSARENFNFSELCKVKIPLPPIEIQQSIVNIYTCLEEAKKIASEAREKLKTLCPALVQRAANS